MSIVTRYRREVKPTRVSPKPAAPFGHGILASKPTFKAPATVSDLDWASQTFGAQSDRFDTIELTRLATRPTADEILHEGSDPRHCSCKPCVMTRTARYADRGMMSPDVADYIERTSLVGHPA